MVLYSYQNPFLLCISIGILIGILLIWVFYRKGGYFSSLGDYDGGSSGDSGSFGGGGSDGGGHGGSFGGGGSDGGGDGGSW